MPSDRSMFVTFGTMLTENLHPRQPLRQAPWPQLRSWYVYSLYSRRGKSSHGWVATCLYPTSLVWIRFLLTYRIIYCLGSSQRVSVRPFTCHMHVFFFCMLQHILNLSYLFNPRKMSHEVFCLFLEWWSMWCWHRNDVISSHMLSFSKVAAGKIDYLQVLISLRRS